MTDIKTFGTVAVGFGVVAIILNVFVGTLLGVSQVTNATATVEIEGGDGTIVEDMEVQAINSSTTSLEDAVKLSGEPDSKVSASFDGDVDANWSVCSWAAAEPSVVDGNESRTIVGYNDVVLSYNGSDDVYRAWYYDESSRNSYTAEVAAPTANATDSTLVCAVGTESSLTVWRNTTAGTSVATTGESTAPAPPSANWNGTVEETRVWDYDLNSSQVSEFHSEPVLAISGPAPVARLTYDTWDRSSDSVRVHFAGGSASLSSASFTDGFDAVPVQAGTDFKTTGLLNNTVVPTDTGVVEEGTVLFLRWTGQGGTVLTTLASSLGGALNLLALGVVVLAAAMILQLYDEF